MGTCTRGSAAGRSAPGPTAAPSSGGAGTTGALSARFQVPTLRRRGSRARTGARLIEAVAGDAAAACQNRYGGHVCQGESSVLSHATPECGPPATPPERCIFVVKRVWTPAYDKSPVADTSARGE